jgi:prepilin-type processing-associated H-X9-DG protein
MNGVFGWKFCRQFCDVRDGLSNTLAMGEFVHRDRNPDSTFHVAPGNVRSWIFGAASLQHMGLFTCKAIVHAPNAEVDRVSDSGDDVPFNYLPMGSYHPGGLNFLRADGSGFFLSESVELETYGNLATCNGGEVASMP